MKNILVPTDFSENASKAALFAGEIAKRNGAVIYLMHAMDSEENSLHQPLFTGDESKKKREAKKEKELIDFQHILGAIYEEVQIRPILETTDAKDAIIEIARVKEIDLIIMGTRGAGIIKSRITGTITASVVAQSNLPVLVIPENYRIEEPDGILFATSHFETEPEILNILAKMAGLFSAAIHIVYFVNSTEVNKLSPEESEQKVQEYLRLLKQTYPSISFRVELLEGTDFEAALQLYHSVHETDITAMVHYPKGFWDQLFLRDQTKKLVFHSNRPVLVIPCKKPL